MAAKKPSITKQLKDARVELAAQAQQVERLTKDLKSASDAKDAFYRARTELQTEIDQVHSLIDALPGSIPRQSEPGEYGGRTTHALMTRLAAWLAVKP